MPNKTSGTNRIAAAQGAEDIADNDTTHKRPTAVYIGVGASYDFYLENEAKTQAWQTFPGLVTGSIIPISPAGARHTSGGTAPDANDLVFLFG